jgi:O-antigen/teichoic acid export membrane protein
VGLSHLLISRTDRIMLGILGSAEDVGIYNAAATLSVQAALFLASFNAIFAPTIADLFHKQRMKELAALFKTTTKWIFTLTLPVVLVFVLFAWPIMRVFGPGFSAGSLVLISLGIAELVNAGVGSVAFMLTMTSRQNIELLNSIALGSLNVVLNLILIPKLHVLGAAIATGLSIALINILRLIEVYWLYKVHPYKLSYWKPIVAGGVATLVWIGIRRMWNVTGWIWIIAIVLFGVVYMLAFVALGLDDEERLILKAVKGLIYKRLGGNH